jgi:hypothetical protein
MEKTMPVKFTVLANHTAKISLDFSCANENEVIISDAASGERVWSAISSNPKKQMNFDGIIKPTKTTDFIVKGQHKESGYDGNKPWLPSVEKIVMNTAQRIAVRYEDGTDGDFNDARIEIEIA